MTRVHVLDLDIKKGQSCECRTCPIAIALKRHWEGDLMVGAYNTWFYEQGNVIPITVQHPEVVQDFIEDFDMGKKVKPFSFDIEITRAAA